MNIKLYAFKTILVLAALLLQTQVYAQPGNIDLSFDPGTGADNAVVSLAIQSDGKILIVGSFTTYNGTALNYIARLNSDGSLDPAFNPGTGADVFIESVALQSDGKILIGGNFNTYNGTSINRIARLNTNGSLDTTFNPGSGADNIIRSIVLQSDGKILIGGFFTTYNGTSRNYIARLNSDGSLDTGFDPGTGANAAIHSLALQSDGNILIGGDFTTFNGTSLNYIARVNPDGSLDIGFNPGSGANSTVTTLALQIDGKILLGGLFTAYNGTSRNYIDRLVSIGSEDFGFSPGSGADNLIRSIALQSDGKILIGGAFTAYNGTSLSHIARLNSDGSQDTGFDPGTGASIGDVRTIALQSDGNILLVGDFTSYNGTARNGIARIFGGNTTPTPDINIKSGGSSIPSFGNYTFPSTNVGTSSSLVTFTIENLGNDTLALFGSPKIGISGGTDFTVDQTATASTLVAGASTTFTITFNPTTSGTRADTIIIFSNDSDESNYFITLSGTGTTAASPAPEINVKAGASIPSSGTFTFPGTNVGTSSPSISFTIENLGTDTLALFGSPIIGISGGTDFIVDQTTVASMILDGSFTTFTVTFNPTASGARSDTITIFSNDADESIYFIMLSGTGIAPEINVKAGGSSIPSGGNFDLGSSNVGTPTAAATFTIENLGTGNLTLQGPRIIIAHGTDFTVDQTSTASPIVAGGSTTFTVTFNPTASGARADSIVIFNDDADESNYFITLSGTGTTAASPAPEINVKAAGSSIPSTGSYTFSSSNVGISSAPVTFTIENTGTDTLSLTGFPLVAISDTFDFIIDQTSVTSAIMGGSSTTFSVRFKPFAIGGRQSDITITNNDTDEGSYLIHLYGTGIDTTPTSTITSMHIVGNEFVLPKSVESYKVEVPPTWIYTYTWTYTGTNYIFVPDSIGTNIGLFFTDSATSGKLRCTATAGGGTVFTYEEIDISINNIITDASKLAKLKCPVEITDCAAGYIDNFIFNSIINLATGCSNNGYTDYTRSNLVDTLPAGGVYSASVNIPNTNAGIINYAGMWVDYNNDGDFTGPDEFVAGASGSNSHISLTNIIFTNKEGYDGPKRLRVRSRPGVAFTSAESCSLLGESGETEDYLIVLDAQDALEAPQIITPNDDGKNDYFVIRGIKPATENKLTVFDRVGAVKYSSSNYENNWNGTANGGDKLSPGTYYFVFTNNSKSIKGFLEIRY